MCVCVCVCMCVCVRARVGEGGNLGGFDFENHTPGQEFHKKNE